MARKKTASKSPAEAAVNEAKAYATWLLFNGYVPFELSLHGVGGLTGIVRGDIEVHMDAQTPKGAAARHAKRELEIAAAVASGEDVPNDWPGERCLQVYRARTTKPLTTSRKRSK